MTISPGRKTRQRGSALLIVFLFAAVVAIMLYSEMPVVAFEARRQKEQLLIDRADEYKHAVKLYYKKVGGYPGSLKQLENTNGMRFLRHSYKDPFTGKDDWRLLHMGPGNRLVDSKVNLQTPFGQTGKGAGSANSAFSGNSSTGSSSTFGNGLNASSSFGSNSSGFTGLSKSDSDSEPAVKVPPVRQRGPAIPASGDAGSDDLSGGLSADGSLPLPSDLPGTGVPSMPDEAGAPPSHAPGQANGGMPPNGQPPGTNMTQMVQGLFGSQPPRQGSSSRGLGVMNGGGGIAGVASRASGQSIKTINDQSDYSLWEFYYDPSKDVQPGLAGGAQPGAATANPGNSTQNPASGTANSAAQSNSFSLGSGVATEGFNQTGNTISSGRTNSAAQNPPQ